VRKEAREKKTQEGRKKRDFASIYRSEAAGLERQEVCVLADGLQPRDQQHHLARPVVVHAADDSRPLRARVFWPRLRAQVDAVPNLKRKKKSMSGSTTIRNATKVAAAEKKRKEKTVL
jgi:hypothetical protein